MAEPRRLVRRAELIATHPGFVDPDSTVIDRDLSKSSRRSVALGRPSDARGTRDANRPSEFILENSSARTHLS